MWRRARLHALPGGSVGGPLGKAGERRADSGCQLRDSHTGMGRRHLQVLWGHYSERGRGCLAAPRGKVPKSRTHSCCDNEGCVFARVWCYRTGGGVCHCEWLSRLYWATLSGADKKGRTAARSLLVTVTLLDSSCAAVTQRWV